MALIKTQKSSPYFARYQVKYKRRRQGKTDYAARKKLIMQAKNKYNSPKYRLVVRFTNKDIIVQIVYAKIQGDIVLTSAYAHELPRYGIKYGLTNWAAAYATGLLCARRALQKLGLDEKYEGIAEPDGTLQLTEALEEEDSPRPFKCYLDAGLKRTSTGSKVFGALKGASDGGIYIPHSEKRFPGYDIESKELDAETLKKYIYGGHVAEYMEALEEEDEEKFRKVFSRYLEDDIGGDDLEELYTEAHAKIREDPSAQLTDKSKLNEWKENSKKSRQSKLSRKERQDRIREKIAAIKAGAGASSKMDEDDDEEDE